MWLSPCPGFYFFSNFCLTSSGVKGDTQFSFLPFRQPISLNIEVEFLTAYLSILFCLELCFLHFLLYYALHSIELQGILSGWAIHFTYSLCSSRLILCPLFLWLPHFSFYPFSITLMAFLRHHISKVTDFRLCLALNIHTHPKLTLLWA